MFSHCTVLHYCILYCHFFPLYCTTFIIEMSFILTQCCTELTEYNHVILLKTPSCKLVFNATVAFTAL